MMIRQIAFLLLMSFSASVLAGPWNDFKNEFKDLIEEMSSFGDEAERNYTIGQLTKLHRDLLRIERSKEDIIFILNHPGIFEDNKSEILIEAKQATESARTRLKNIGDRVARLSEHASTIEQILSNSLRSRKSWLSQVDFSHSTHSEYLIEEGEMAIKSINYSRKHLERFLRKENT